MIKSCLKKIYLIFHPCRVHGKRNIVKIEGKKNKAHINIYGNDNYVFIKKAQIINELEININGDNCRVEIGDNCRIYGPCNILVEEGGQVSIGANTGLRGVTILARKAEIMIGEDCMTSYDVIIRNHDSHEVISNETGEIVNAPRSIKIGNHVWLGQKTTVLKGSEIGDNSIVAFGAVVTKGSPSNSIIAGNPGKVVKQNVTWRK